MFNLFLNGLFIGLAIAASPGPMAILCIQRSLHEGFRVGLMTGIGVAIADGTYSLITGLGLTAVSDVLIKYEFYIKIIGGLFLIFLGIKAIISQATVKSALKTAERSSWHAFSTAYFITLTSPATILLFIAIFASLGVGTNQAGVIPAVNLASGLVLGSSLWWLILSASIVYIIHKRLSPKIMKIINIISGLIFIGFGLMAFFK